jgi:hypothetical protein
MQGVSYSELVEHCRCQASRSNQANGNINVIRLFGAK